MYRPLQQTLFALVGVTLLAPWVVAGQAMGAAANPPTTPALPTQTSSYVVQAEANQPASEIQHGYFTLSVSAGQTKTVRIVIKNTGHSVVRISDYPADGVQIAAGGIDFGTEHTPLTAVGTWISVQPKQLTLLPGQAQRITATITLPAHTTAGDYVGGVAMEDQAVQGQGAGSHLLIAVHYRKVIAILASVPGLRSATAQVVGVALTPQFTGAQAVISVHNTGNILLQSKGTIELLGNKGTMQRFPFTTGTILPAAVARIPVLFPHLLLQIGTYGLRVQLTTVHNAALATWHGNVGYMLPSTIRPAAPATNVLLQPAQGAPQQGSSLASSAQPLPMVLYGGVAILVLVLGAGLGVVLSRRPPYQHA